MNENNAQTIANVGSFIRLGLMLVAGPFIAKGYVDGNTIDAVAGGLAVVMVGVWVVYKNWRTHQNTAIVAQKAAMVAGAAPDHATQIAAAVKAGTL